MTEERDRGQNAGSATQAGALHIDPIACDGVGICAHVAPELITVDRWGYPIIRDEALVGRLGRQARAAVRACPHRALFLR